MRKQTLVILESTLDLPTRTQDSSHHQDFFPIFRIGGILTEAASLKLRLNPEGPGVDLRSTIQIGNM